MMQSMCYQRQPIIGFFPAGTQRYKQTMVGYEAGDSLVLLLHCRG